MKKKLISLFFSAFIFNHSFSINMFQYDRCAIQVIEKLANIKIEGHKYSFEVYDDYYSSLGDRMKNTINEEGAIIESILFTSDRKCEIVFSATANEAQINGALTHVVTVLGFSAYTLE